jgi:RNA polymerase sigma factor (TIGR02999 family)
MDTPPSPDAAPPDPSALAPPDEAIQERTLTLATAMAEGDLQAADELLPILYDELRRLAARRLYDDRAGHTLQPTSLVHEAYLRLVGNHDPGWKGKAHFFGAAAEAMRRILIDRARHRAAVRHGGNVRRTEFHDDLPEAPRQGPDLDELIDVSVALEKLGSLDPDCAEIVKLRVLAGMTNEEVAGLLNVSESTVKRRWSYGKAWITRELTGDGDGGGELRT